MGKKAKWKSRKQTEISSGEVRKRQISHWQSRKERMSLCSVLARKREEWPFHPGRWRRGGQHHSWRISPHTKKYEKEETIVYLSPLPKERWKRVVEQKFVLWGGLMDISYRKRRSKGDPFLLPNLEEEDTPPPFPWPFHLPFRSIVWGWYVTILLLHGNRGFFVTSKIKILLILRIF